MALLANKEAFESQLRYLDHYMETAGRVIMNSGTKIRVSINGALYPYDLQDTDSKTIRELLLLDVASKFLGTMLMLRDVYELEFEEALYTLTDVRAHFVTTYGELT